MIKKANLRRFFPMMLFLMLALVGCRVNNGDIGPLYGTWNIESLTVDGVEYEEWRSETHPWTTVEFQNNICMIKQAFEPNDYLVRVCTWSWLGGEDDENAVLRLDFNHSDDHNPPGTGIYAPPAWLLLSGRLTVDLSVTFAKHDRRMTWTTVNASGQKLVFRLKQTW
ncbi:MAG: hypothetical protein K2K84_02730 [Muribaculaceae bacterium]|nr:hypothetical protein [Muribaculaceae bacterium]